jgi:probable FeS assembly SUF system protein SufT
MMDGTAEVTLTRDVDAAVVPTGVKVTLMRGETARITQSLGGTFTVVVNGNMFRIEGRDADALGQALEARAPVDASGPLTQEQLEQKIWAELKNVYDPEIPVNVVDLGLIYDCHLTPLDGERYRAEVKMTLTAPGCGMGPVLQQDVHQRLLAMDRVVEAQVDLVWDPPWTQAMMSEAARLQLGLY